MAKSNRATRKELETVIQKMIKELQVLRAGFEAINNCFSAYINFKGDSLTFNDYLKTEIEKMKDKEQVETKRPATKDTKSAKKSRYNKIITPPL